MPACRIPVRNKCPFHARQWATVCYINKTAKRFHAGNQIIRGGGEVVKIVTKNINGNRQRTTRTLLLLCDADVGARKVRHQGSHLVH